METLDVFPTLCELAGVPQPEFAQGVSLTKFFGNPDAAGHPAIAYSSARTIRTKSHRLIVHRNGHVELYDHTSPEKETKNVAEEHPDVVADLTAQLKARLQ